MSHPRPHLREVLQFSCVRMMSAEKTSSPPAPVFEKQKIPPFVKDLFLGKFNKNLLSYAEILDDEKYLNLESNIKQGGFKRLLCFTFN